MDNIQVLAGLLGGAIMRHVIGNWILWRRGNYTITKEQRKDTVDELYGIIARLTADIATTKEEATQARKDTTAAIARESDCHARAERQDERIDNLEDALRNAGIKFRPFKKYKDKGI